MNKQVWKFVLSVGLGTVSMPAGAKILTVENQNGNATIWAEVDTKAKLEARHFRAYGTGHEIEPCKREYIGTMFFNDTILGPLVFHVYEVWPYLAELAKQPETE